MLQTSGAGKAQASPAVRKLAKDLGIDINTVAGTGLGGRVTDKDVRNAPGNAPGSILETTPANASETGDISGGGETIAFRSVRRKIAERLRESVQTAVHFNVMDEADVSALDVFRKQYALDHNEKVGFLPFILAAVTRSLKKFPALNTTVDDKAAAMIRHRSVHLGLAVDTDHGLTVPVIRDAETLGVVPLEHAVKDLAAQARDRSIPRDQLMGSTFTVSNVGSYAGRFATPIINYPEVAILATGRVREGVVVRQGQMHVAKLMPLSLACDHRVVDGAESALFLADIIEQLQHPEALVTAAPSN